jgi:hypothetical protein
LCRASRRIAAVSRAPACSARFLTAAAATSDTTTPVTPVPIAPNSAYSHGFCIDAAGFSASVISDSGIPLARSIDSCIARSSSK